MATTTPLPFQLRPASSADFPFWKDLHRITMRALVEPIWGWDEAVQDALVRARYRPATTAIITVAGADAGGLDREDVAGGILLSAIMLLPAYQNRGIGSTVVRDLMAKAVERDAAVFLSVLRTNHARHLYERLGFVTTHQDEIRYQMRWLPAPAAG